MDSSNQLKILIETNRLTGPNFNDWLRNLRIVLSLEKIDYVLDNLPMKEVQEGANEEEKIAYGKWKDDDTKASCYMLASMNNELQKQHFNTESAYEILLQLQKMYKELRVDRFSISGKLFSMRMPFGSFVKDHVLEMVNYIQQLEKLGSYMSKDLAADLILQSLPEPFSQFIMDSDFVNGDYNLLGLLDRLISAEANMKNTKCTLLDSSKSSSISNTNTELEGNTNMKKAQPKLTSGVKKAYLKLKASIKKAHLKPKGGITKAHLKPKVVIMKSQLDSEISVKKNELRDADWKGKCFGCGKEGHFKRNCKDDSVPFTHIPVEGVIMKSQLDSEISVKKSELTDSDWKGKCFRCGKEGHHVKNCKDDLPFTHIPVEENLDDWHMWKKPKSGWIKLNTDACLKGYGGLFRDHEGKPLCAYVVKSATNDINIAEFLAVLKGISEAYVRGYKCLWVESDSLCVVRTINREQSCPPVAALYLDQILQFKSSFENFRITFSWRECNKAADHLSKMHSIIDGDLVNCQLLTPDDFPESLSTIIKDDAGGRLYYRRTSRSTCQLVEGV